MLEPYQMLLVFYRWWELHIDVSFYFPLDPSWFVIWQLSFYPVHDDCIIGIISSSHKCHDQSHHLHYLIIEWRLYYLYHSIYKCHDHFHHLPHLGLVCHDESIICIVWDHHLHHSIIAMTLSSFALSYYHQRFHSLSFPHCKKHETEVPVDFIIVFTSFALQICSMLENTFLFPGAIRLFHYHKPSNSISFSIMLRCLGN